MNYSETRRITLSWETFLGDFDRPHEDAPIADDNVFADYFQGVVMAVRAREYLGPRVTGH